MPVGFTFDQAKCTGCQACILACTIENGLAFNHSWRTVYTFNERHHSDIAVSHLSLACNHCEYPACLRACPANAYTKDAVTGHVVLDQSKCIGCRYCTWACPYGAPGFDEDRGVVSKCTFCDDRQKNGLDPACVASCPTGALGVGAQVAHGNHALVPGFTPTDIGPAIAIEPASDKRRVPECSATTAYRTHTLLDLSPGSRLALRSEWPLAAFTYLTTLLVALLAGSALGGQSVSPYVFVAIVASAVLLSSSHLGRKTRAWRAVLNPSHSWLSREVLLFSVLGCVGTWYLTFAPGSRVGGALAITIGACTLLAIDRVYGTLPLVDRHGFHSAGAILTGLLFTGVFLDSPLVAGAIGAVKVVSYVRRKAAFQSTGRVTRSELTVLRTLFGFLVPGIFWSLTGSGTQVFVVSTVLLGELIDRLEFYLELDMVSPERQMSIDLQRAI